MNNERWLPAKYALPDGSRLGRLLYGGSDWQIYAIGQESSVLVVSCGLADRWIESKFLSDKFMNPFSFGKEQYRTILSGSGQRLEPVAANNSPDTKSEGLSFALSLRETRKIDADVPLHDAIYLERYSRLLPTWTVSERKLDEEVLGRWLTGGVSIPATSFRRLSSLLGWLDKNDVADLVREAGFTIPQDSDEMRTKQGPKQSETKSENAEALSSVRSRRFHLSGRPDLEAFFNEHIIEIIENSERYKALGIEFPAAIILHGPPGCGKTFAVERLVEHLDWPVFLIDSNSVGSSYVHGTSRKISEIFDKAMDAAPSMIVIDEMESYLSDRQIHQSTGLHHVEEVAEFLRRIPEASKRHVLIIGMTNRLEMIDSAILRRGRFDHIVEVGMPSAVEVQDLIDSLLAKVPVEGEIDTDNVVKLLTGRPLSDVAFVVREAARLAARSGKNALDDESLQKALTGLPSIEPEKRPIGFIQD